MSELLHVKDLATYFFTHEGTVRAVDGVSFSIEKGKTLGLVGESGCGKSVTALSIMRLVQTPPGRIVGGEVLFEGQDLLQYDERRMRDIRGSKISMIFQEPMTSLDPVFTIGHEIMETVRLHQGKKHRAAVTQAVESLRTVGIPDPERRITNYPHELSGGMRQRAMIAMALSCGSRLERHNHNTAVASSYFLFVMTDAYHLPHRTGEPCSPLWPVQGLPQPVLPLHSATAAVMASSTGSPVSAPTKSMLCTATFGHGLTHSSTPSGSSRTFFVG